ncbi:MAG: hypothetical protein EOP87_17500 [Verrucomicrobiaceae bacterium]|nr:MAG: hypothetical protein EOP87_17500 [Verrucomicrobiaceae bacterium]
MPRRILIIGLLYCLCGVLAIWSSIEGLSNATIHLNLSVFMLPVGIGLLRGLRSSLKWARVWVGLGYLFAALGFVLLFVYPDRASAHFFDSPVTGDQAVPYVIVMLVFFVLVLATVDTLLRSSESRAYCQAGDDGTREDRGNEPVAPDALRNAAAFYALRDAENRKADAARTSESGNH